MDSSLACRVIIADSTSRLPIWDTMLAELPQGCLTPLDPRAFYEWDVNALSLVFQIGPAPRPLAEALPLLSRLRACSARIGYRKSGGFVVILEKRLHTPLDLGALRDEIGWFTQRAPTANGSCCHRPQESAAPPAPPSAAGRPALSSSGLPPGIRTVVLVEDNARIRVLCTRILQDKYLVFETADSLDALDLADRLPVPVHVLVTDYHLPTMDGAVLAQTWRLHRPESHILLLSGDLPPTGRMNQFRFLRKPFSAETLLTAAMAGEAGDGKGPRPQATP